MRQKTKFNVLIVGCGRIAGGFDMAINDKESYKESHKESYKDNCKESDKEIEKGKSLALTHAGAFSAHDGFELQACVDPNVEKHETFKADWDVSQSYASMNDIPDAEKNFDVISLCSPSDLHVAHLQSALSFGPKLVFCEKPLTPRSQQTQYWVDHYRDAGVLLAVNYTRRWDPDILKLKRDLDQGVWGEVRSVTASYNKGLFNNGSHMVDLLQLLFGELSAVSAGKAVIDGSDKDPSIPALLYTQAGFAVQLNVSDAGDFSFFEMQIITQQGVIAMENGGMHWRVRRVITSDTFAGYKNLDSGEQYTGAYSQAMSGAAENIYQALTINEALNSSGENAIMTQKVCDTIRRLSANI